MLKIPDKRYTFDVRRERSSLQHLIAEDLDVGAFDKRAHFEDWVENVVGRRRATPEFDRELNNLLEIDYSIHYHVWTDRDIREIVDYTRTTLHLHWRPVVLWEAHFYRKECVVVLERMH